MTSPWQPSNQRVSILTDTSRALFSSPFRLEKRSEQGLSWTSFCASHIAGSRRAFLCVDCARVSLRATILDKIKWYSKLPSPPNQGWSRAKGKNVPFSHPWFGGGGEGGLCLPFILSKIEALLFGQAKRALWERVSEGPRKGELSFPVPFAASREVEGHLWLVLIGFHDFQIFPDRTSRVWSVEVGKHMFGLSLFCPSRQSNPSPRRSHVGRRKIQISPPPVEQDWSNVLSQGQQRQSNPHAMPCPPARRLYIDRCITYA